MGSVTRLPTDSSRSARKSPRTEADVITPTVFRPKALLPVDPPKQIATAIVPHSQRDESDHSLADEHLKHALETLEQARKNLWATERWLSDEMLVSLKTRPKNRQGQEKACCAEAAISALFVRTQRLRRAIEDILEELNK